MAGSLPERALELMDRITTVPDARVYMVDSVEGVHVVLLSEVVPPRCSCSQVPPCEAILACIMREQKDRAARWHVKDDPAEDYTEADLEEER